MQLLGHLIHTPDECREYPNKHIVQVLLKQLEHAGWEQASLKRQRVPSLLKFVKPIMHVEQTDSIGQL